MENIPINTNEPTHTGRHAADRPNGSTGPKPAKKKFSMKVVAVIAGVVLLLLVAFGGWSLYQSSPAAHIDNSKYQAVFFTNGQVYFGKLHKLGGSYFSLTDIFYIQSKSSDTAGDSANPQQTSDSQGADLQLVKLGEEVHGPTDKMIIGKEQILFFENLKSDGKVSASIDKYRSQKPQ